MKKLLIALLSILCITSCSKVETFKIKVNLQNSNGKTIRLEQYVNEDLTKIGAVVVKNDKAVFKVEKSENQDAFMINIDGWKRPLTFFAENQDVMITGDCQDFNNINVQAGELQSKLDTFTKSFDAIENEDEEYMAALSFVKENIENMLGAYALYRYKWAFGTEDIEKLMDAMSDFPSGKSAYVKLMKNYYVGLMSVSVGQPFTDFKQAKLNGDDFVLSEMIGTNKLIMIDFWASWCPDCRKENPNVVAVYNAFHKKGLEIVSVSLDTDKEAWLKAIVDDNLTWPTHVSDLKGWSNDAAAKYFIVSIPQNVLINEEGTIVARNLTGEELSNFVKKFLKSGKR